MGAAPPFARLTSRRKSSSHARVVSLTPPTHVNLSFTPPTPSRIHLATVDFRDGTGLPCGPGSGSMEAATPTLMYLVADGPPALSIVRPPDAISDKSAFGP